MSDEWDRPEQPPPPLFLGKKERDLVKQVNDELIERVIGQQVLYYPISLDHTNFHPLYGEAIEKTFLPPVRVYALVDWEGQETSNTSAGIDKRSSITVHFHKRRLTADQNLFVRLGDFFQYDQLYFEIVDVFEPRYLFGQDSDFADGTSLEVTAIGREAREGLFNAN